MISCPARAPSTHKPSVHVRIKPPISGRASCNWRLISRLALLAVVASRAEAQVKDPSGAQQLPLLANETISRPLRGGEQHVYRLEIDGERFVRVRAEQRDNSVILLLVSPSGDTLADRDDYAGLYAPAEMLSVILPRAGSYRIVVRGYGDSSLAGSYVLARPILRTPSGDDVLRARAESLFDRSSELDIHFGQDSLQQSVALLRKAGALALAVNDGAVRSRALLSLGSRWREAGQLDSSAQAYLAAQAAVPPENEPDIHIDAEVSRGADAYMRSDLSRAIALHEDALSIALRTGHRSSVARIRSNLGLMFSGVGENEAALRQLLDARATMASISPRHAGLAAALLNLSAAYEQLGRYQPALDLYAEARELARALNDTGTLAVALNNEGALLSALGRRREALDRYQQAIPFYQADRDWRGYARALNNVAVQLGDSLPLRARASYLQSLAIARANRDQAGEGATLHNIGMWYHGHGRDTVVALAYLDSARLVRQLISDRAGEADTQQMTAMVLLEQGAVDSAAVLAQSAIRIARANRLPVQEAEALERLAQVFMVRAEYDSALVALAASRRLSEARRRSLTARGLRTSLAAEFAQGYELTIDALMQRHAARPGGADDRQALEMVEQSRARGLSESLGEVRLALQATLDPRLLADEQALRRALHSAAGQRPTTEAGRVDRSRTLDSLLAAVDDLQRRMRATDSHYADATDERPTTVERLQRDLLDDDTVLLEYSLGRSRSYVWAVTKDRVTSAVLPGRQIIDSLVRRHLEQLTARSRRVPGESAAQWRARIARADAALPRDTRHLSHVLLAPVREQLSGRRVVISAAGSVQLVPWAHLPAPDAVDAPAGWTHLLAERDVLLLPSARIALQLRQRAATRRPSTRELAVFADPVFDPLDARVRQARLHAQRSDPGVVDSAGAQSAALGELQIVARDAGVNADDAPLPRLTNSGTEGEALLAMVPANRRKAYIGFDASLGASLDSTLRDYRIIHFASHALLDDQRPELSGIALSQVDRQGRPVDGYLRLHHLYGMDLQASLVVLSACQTALGREIRGEGLVGLARGFMQAGATRVVGSLWKVDDAATAALMQRFYANHLRKEMPVPRALREAQLWLRGKPRWSAPYYWAGFTVQGDWQ